MPQRNPLFIQVLHANKKSKVQKIKYVFMSCNTIEAENYELLKLLEISPFSYYVSFNAGADEMGRKETIVSIYHLFLNCTLKEVQNNLVFFHFKRISYSSIEYFFITSNTSK